MTFDRDKVLCFRPDEEIRNYAFRPVRGLSKHGNVLPLGEGGSGVVYLVGQELLSGVEVLRAIKFFCYRKDILEIRQSDTSGPVSRDNFLAEVQSIASISHENLIKVIDAGVLPKEGMEIPYLVSDYIDGPTLRQVIEDSTGVGQPVRKWFLEDQVRILECIIKLGRAVSHLHSRSFYHCDIAPKNVFMKPDEGYSPILGDLGTTKSAGLKLDDVLVAGSKSYMTGDALEFLNTEVDWDTFSKLQPHWDNYAFAKTAQELLQAFAQSAEHDWYEPAMEALQHAKDKTRYRSIDRIVERLEFLRPIHREVASVPELSPGLSGKTRKLMPVEPLSLSKRISDLIKHPALTRLGKVPQLTTAEHVFPGATHTRYEHSLGVMETVRQYLMALLNQHEFLAHLSVEKIETALLAGLFHNITRFPLSNVFHEIKGKGGGNFHQFSRANLLPEILSIQNSRGRTITDLVSASFPQVSMDAVTAIITDDTTSFSEEDQFVHSLLNSSLDARVVDFVRRDALHLGIAKGNSFDLDELLPHLTIHNHKLALRTTGVTVAEQIISLRYWLFTRVYWSRPNRAFCSMLRECLLRLMQHDGFLDELGDVVLTKSQKSLIRFISQKAGEYGDAESENVCSQLLSADLHLFRMVLDVSVAESAELTPVCNKVFAMSYQEMSALGESLEEHLHTANALAKHEGIKHVIIDVPFESGATKLGEDIVVVRDDGSLIGLAEFSGIVEGVNKSFDKHLTRLRVMVHPEVFPSGDEARGSIRAEVSSFLIRHVS